MYRRANAAGETVYEVGYREDGRQRWHTVGSDLPAARDYRDSVVNRSPGRKHGQSGAKPTPTYTTWRSMRQRCRDRQHSAYRHYGGRGIRVCGRWESFESFLADMGERPEDRSIDRVDVNGHYSCGKCEECVREGWGTNCKWSTPVEQRTNQRRRKS